MHDKIKETYIKEWKLTRLLKSRKSLLVTMTGILLIAAVLLPTFIFPSPASAGTPLPPPTQVLKNSGKTETTVHITGAATTLAFYGPAEWLISEQCWSYVFQLSATDAMRYKSYGNLYRCYGIQSVTMTVKPYSNQNGFKSIHSSTYPEYQGSIPEESFPPAYYDAAVNAVMAYSVDSIGSVIPGVSFIWTTAQLVAGLRSGTDVNRDSIYTLSRTWNYNGVSDAAQFLRFFVFVKPKQTVVFSVGYSVKTPESRTSLTLGGYRYQISAPGPKTAASSTLKSAALPTQNWNPGMMTAAEKKTYGIEEIQISQLTSQRARELNISPENIKAAQDAGETVIYIANSLKVTQVK